MDQNSNKSISGFTWKQKTYDQRLAQAICQRFDLPDSIATILAAKEILLEEVEDFLNPKIKTSLPNPFDLLDMDHAVTHVVEAIQNNQKITIFADYDVDGATSSALLKRFFRLIGVDVNIYVPDRALEGYGPNTNALLTLKENGTDLVITVDCGTVAFEPLEEAAKAGLDVIVIDHHIGITQKPEAVAVVNPNRIDENFSDKNICAAAVSFLFAVAINKRLRESGFYSDNHPPLEGGSKSEAIRGGVKSFQNRPLLGSLRSPILSQGEDDLWGCKPLEGGSKSSISRRGYQFPTAKKLYSKEILAKAKNLRSNQTDAEGLLWYYLNNKQLNGHKFRKQHPLGNYIVDFICLEKKLIVELDGDQHGQENNIKHDEKRTRFLNEQGYKVLRFWNHDVFERVFDVLDSILVEVDRLHPLQQIILPLREDRRAKRFEEGSKSCKMDDPSSVHFVHRSSLKGRMINEGEGNLTPRKEPNLMNLLDLVALGTVCDVMPLTGINRVFVSQGLNVMAQRKNLGLRTIFDMAGLDEKPTAYHLGFVIGPRINAGGRVGKSDLGARLLSTEDEMEAMHIATQLEEFNQQRKDIETEMLQDAQEQLATKQYGFGIDDAVIFAMSEHWHQGVIGIVASRLKDLYNKPVAVIAIADGKGKASCRSISGVDFGSAILNARMQGLLLEGGGHAMAGGFSVQEDKILDLHQFFNQSMQEKVLESQAMTDKFFSASLDLTQVNIELLKDIAKLEPFGTANSKPRFIIRNLQKIRVSLVGKTKEHISCVFSSKSALGLNGNIQGILFGGVGTAVGEILLDSQYKKPINIVGQLNINSWMGVDKVQLLIEDIIL